MNTRTNTQKFHFDHKDDVMAFALHPNGKIIATGEIGPHPLISIWDSSTMESIASFNSPLTKGIAHLEFSPSGKLLAASAMDDYHCVAIYEWEKKSSKRGGALIATGKGTRANILDLVFSPDESELVCPAVKEVQFVSFKGGVLKTKKGTGWGTKGKRTSVLCGAFVGNKLVTGTFSGDIYTWNGRSINKKLKAHEKGCNTIFPRKNTPGFLTGGNDGKVFIWNDKFEKIKTFDLHDKTINSFNPRIRSVCENDSGTRILVGTRGGEIVELNDKKSIMHLRSHSVDELWGLACHPKQDLYYTVGQDCMLAIWDIKSRRQIKFARLDCPADVLEFSHDATYLAIGY